MKLVLILMMALTLTACGTMDLRQKSPLECMEEAERVIKDPHSPSGQRSVHGYVRSCMHEY